MNTGLGRNLSKASKGFTLMEMVVVIIIITILAALSMPAMSRVTSESAAYASASEIAKTLQLAQELAVAYKRPHAVLFNNKESDGASWDPTGEHHWYTLLGPTTVGDGPSSSNYYQGETIDPDGIQIGAHHYLRPGVRFWSQSEDFSEGADQDGYIPGFSTTVSGYDSDHDPRMGSEPTWAYTDFWEGHEDVDTTSTSQIFALPNYQFSREDATNDGNYPLFVGLVSNFDPEIRYIISAEQNTGRVTIARNARVAW